MNTAGRSSSTISSSTDPPTTCRVTENGDKPPNATTLAAIATPVRAARWASTSMPRGVPAAVTTTAPVVSRTACTALAHDAPP